CSGGTAVRIERPASPARAERGQPPQGARQPPASWANGPPAAVTASHHHHPRPNHPAQTDHQKPLEGRQVGAYIIK
ncbi:MAG: hypothetical protein IJA81_02135, partial [Akkermansia sp.]|nr:hypothetical protein [Akkermansia sp.]